MRLLILGCIVICPYLFYQTQSKKVVWLDQRLVSGAMPVWFEYTAVSLAVPVSLPPVSFCATTVDPVSGVTATSPATVPVIQSGTLLQTENKSDKTALFGYPILDKSYDFLRHIWVPI